MLRIHTAMPVLILVDRGVKSVTGSDGITVRALAGQAIILDGSQTVDFENVVQEGAYYEARWLLFDPALLGDASYLDSPEKSDMAERGRSTVQLLPRVSSGLADAFERARSSLQASAGVGDSIVRLRMLEVMHWLRQDRIELRQIGSHRDVSARVRASITRHLDTGCRTSDIASSLAMSESTLRRRLAMEGTSLGELVVEARMATALTLLQATTQPVSLIALAVGYASPSRFAVRFRQRFGFPPTSVRGHDRAS